MAAHHSHQSRRSSFFKLAFTSSKRLSDTASAGNNGSVVINGVVDARNQSRVAAFIIRDASQAPRKQKHLLFAD
jgi:hypothetical protein